MKDEILLAVTEVTDTETGDWQQGEIEFSISVGRLEEYLKGHGKKGRDEIINTLAYLIKEVFDRYEETQKEQVCGGGIAPLK